MKTFLVLFLSVTAMFVWQRGGDTNAVTETRPAVQKVAPVAPTAATPRPVSEHNWAKHSLDRAHAVVDQVRGSRQPGEQP